MVFLISILASLSLIAFLKWLSWNQVPAAHALSPHQTKHGHRCFIEGLNEFESEVVRALVHGLDCKEYFIFNNLMIPSEFSGSAQLDHVILSRFGIFVIESKDSSGWIFGKEREAEWTQVMQRGARVPIPNPLHQNWGHILSLQTHIPLDASVFINIVVFSGRSEFKSEKIGSVVSVHELVAAIQSHTERVISQEKLMLAIGKLSYLCQAVEIGVVEHRGNVLAAKIRKKFHIKGRRGLR